MLQVDAADVEQIFWSRLEALAAQLPDWTAVMASAQRFRPLTPDLVRYVQQIEAGPAVLYLLVKYPCAIPDIDVLPADQARAAIDQLVRDCTPYSPLDPAHLFDVGGAMKACVDRHFLFRWIPSGNPH